jgi:predicted Fe-S protein YdhL (DUF1289 family)
MPGIHITDIEAAINFWRERRPSADGFTLAPPVQALASLYARMVFQRQDLADEQAFSAAAWAAWQTWYASTPDTPCIAICSTSQGDAVCKGCGRTESEVQYWPEMGPAEKRSTWRRITAEGTAWRFNRYAERARETQGRMQATPETGAAGDRPALGAG